MAKKKAKKSGLNREVHDIWGWVVLVVGMMVIFSVAGWYYLTMF